jgi:hypothetical protein
MPRYEVRPNTEQNVYDSKIYPWQVFDTTANRAVALTHERLDADFYAEELNTKGFIETEEMEAEEFEEAE